MARSIVDLMDISFSGLGRTRKAKKLKSSAFLTLLLVIWRERNARIF